jgi:hypothetical protein
MENYASFKKSPPFGNKITHRIWKSGFPFKKPLGLFFLLFFLPLSSNPFNVYRSFLLLFYILSVSSHGCPLPLSIYISFHSISASSMEHFVEVHVLDLFVFFASGNYKRRKSSTNCFSTYKNMI